MKALHEMTLDEVLAESRRRDARRAQGLPLTETPAEAAERIAEADSRSEKEIQREIVKLYTAYGCRVYNLSQARASKQSPGLGDLWVIWSVMAGLGPCAWWHEVKTPTGKQSPAQIEFGAECTAAGITYIVGGLATAIIQLLAIGAAVRVGDTIEPRRLAT